MPTPREAYTNSVDRAGISGERVRPANYQGGEIIGRAVQGFGQDLGRVAADVQKIEERDAETAAREADNIRTAKRLERLYGENGYFNKQGRHALEDQPQLEADLRKIDEEAGSILANKPLASRMYSSLTQKRNNDDLPNIFKHSAVQREKHEEQVDTDAFDLAADNASRSLEPAIIGENLNTMADIAERRARRTGLSDENGIAQARQAGFGKGVAAVAERMERQSPAEALAFVTLHADRMDPDDVNKLMTSLEGNAAKERAGSDVANFLVTAGGAYAPATPVPTTPAAPTAVPNFDAVAAALLNVETPGGRHTNPDGSLIRSRAGASGTGQIMPATGPNPGYGVRPLQNNSREEHVRFSKDLLAAYTKSFGGNVVKGLIAYNWGPGNLENHLKKVGNLSDAALVESIPVKEAREYAPKVLSRVGVSVAGATPAAVGAPVAVGQEIDLAATINNIRASDRTFADKEALISEATRIHGYGRQVKNESEERVKDATWQQINQLGDGFTDYDKLPLNLRQQISSNPQFEAQIRNQAKANEQTRLARIESRNAEARGRMSQEAEWDALTLMSTNPEHFKRMDIRKDFPNLTPSDAMRFYKLQQDMRGGKGSSDGANVDTDALITEVNRFGGRVFNDEKTKGVHGKEAKAVMGRVQELAIRMAQQQIKDNGGKPLTDIQRRAIARLVTEPTYVRSKGFTGFVPQGDVGRVRREQGANGPVTAVVNKREVARAKMAQQTGIEPSEEDITAYLAAQGK